MSGVALMRLSDILLGGTCEPWLRLGLGCVDGSISVSGVDLRFDPSSHGLVRCGFSTAFHDGVAPRQMDVDGLEVAVVPFDDISDERGSSAIDGVEILGIDHVVIFTGDLSRTSEAIELGLGIPRRRTREAGQSVVQAFHKLDNTILEIVAGPHVEHRGARWWGFVVTVSDIDRWADAVGDDVATAPRDAVQPGRRISTVHSSVGLGVPVAVMSPHVKVN